MHRAGNIACLTALVFALTIPAWTRVPSSTSELRLAIHRLGVLGTVLYVGAHPDDENTAFLATMARGRLYRTAYFSFTRGEGGQNQIGLEQGDALGILRTQELLAARRIDGAEQFFAQTIDFGFSKSTNETLSKWGHDATLIDAVRIIRTFRPDIIVTRFTPEFGGHGNHTASAQITDEAFVAAADSTRFTDVPGMPKPWRARRLMWNVFRSSPLDTESVPRGTVKLDLGEYSPLLGKSFAEIAGEARSMHKSQGFGAAQNRGSLFNYFQHVAGDTAFHDLCEGIRDNWSRFPGAAPLDDMIGMILAEFRDENPATSIPPLLQLLSAMRKLPPDPLVAEKITETEQVIQGCLGLWAEAGSASEVVAPGDSMQVTISLFNRSSYPVRLATVTVPHCAADNLSLVMEGANRSFRKTYVFQLPVGTPYRQPYWLEQPAQEARYAQADPHLVGLAVAPAPLAARVSLVINDVSVGIQVPVTFKFIDNVVGEIIRPLAIVPPVSVSIQDPIQLFPDSKHRDISVAVSATTAGRAGSLRLMLPQGWHATPENVAFQLRSADDHAVFHFDVAAATKAQSGDFSATATTGESAVSSGVRVVDYAHIPRQRYCAPAQGKLVRLDVRNLVSKVGYVMGSGDEVPAALRQLGCEVTLLSDEDLAGSDLSSYGAIVAGVRAINVRPALRDNFPRLVSYVEKGGNLILQHIAPQRNNDYRFGPLSFRISRDRVAEEDAAVSFLAPSHPALRTPNVIGAPDFSGWTQERGLYFADRWDRGFDSLLVCNDAGEPPRAGGLLVAKLGKGYFVYDAYALFRQLPAGVPGAYRLMANLLSLRVDH
jgi:LmbE family N-acetylglucosaminyl deacetylase